MNPVERIWGYLKRASEGPALQTVNDIAIVIEDIEPHRLGRIKYQATYWFGRCEEGMTLVAGTQVKVIRREGNTWLVQSWPG